MTAFPADQGENVIMCISHHVQSSSDCRIVSDDPHLKGLEIFASSG